jgi:tRNA 2-thiouridine synthesizing protein A
VALGRTIPAITRPAANRVDTVRSDETRTISPADPSETPRARLDVTGLLCPVPVLRTSRRVSGMAEGALLEVVGDDPLLRIDLVAWCAREGHEVVSLAVEDRRITCVLRVGARAR